MTFNTKPHWDKSHEGHPKDRPPSAYAIEKEKLFPRNSVICDLGGGDGADSLYFLQNGHSVFLYDISSSALNIANLRVKEKGYKEKFVTQQMDLAKDKILAENNFFDVVYSRLTLHYFYPSTLVEIFRDIHRVLKEKGVAYIVVKSPEDIDEMKFLKSTAKDNGGGIFIDSEGMIKTRLTKNQYEDILQKAKITNFEIDNYIEHFGKYKIYVKSKADKLLYLEIIIKK